MDSVYMYFSCHARPLLVLCLTMAMGMNIKDFLPNCKYVIGQTHEVYNLNVFPFQVLA